MKVQELVELYKNNPRIDIAKQLEVQEYVSISLKRELARLVLENCTSVIDGEARIDSVERYILFTISVIGMHTNLEFSFDNEESNSINDYDMLCKSGLLIKIIETFKDDYAACQEILNMMTADKLQENMTIEKKFYKFLDEIQNIIGISIDSLIEKLNLESLDLSQLNLGSLLKLYGAIDNK